jgi:hypothetical protein
MREEQARRKYDPNQSPNTWETCPVRTPFIASIDLEQFDLEDQSSVWWDDGWETTSSICLPIVQVASCMFSLKLRTKSGVTVSVAF